MSNLNRKINLINYNITGAAGEFYVAAEISKRGGIATLTVKNTPSVDIIAANLQNGKSASIQVKTRSINNLQGWKLTNKAEIKSTIANHFYVFVKLNVDKLPDYYIIPYNEFADFITTKHQKWLKLNGKDGNPHKDNNIRNFKPEKEDIDSLLGEKYKDKWDILGIF